METKHIYNNLIQILKLIASQPKVQMDTLPKFVNVADEIALMYDDIFLMLPQLEKEDLISSNVCDILIKINELFREMSKDKSLWSVEKLKNDIFWEKSRSLAQDALKELNEPHNNPDIGFVNWIE